MINDVNSKEKIKIIEYLVNNDIDIDYIDAKYKRNALHKN